VQFAQLYFFIKLQCSSNNIFFNWHIPGPHTTDSCALLGLFTWAVWCQWDCQRCCIGVD